MQQVIGTRELRVPITKDPALFDKIGGVGAGLLWLHTYGQRFVPKGERRSHIPPGTAKCLKKVPEEKADYPESFCYDAAARVLRVGDGQFAPVMREVYEFEISGLKVVQSWLRYRMKRGAGKKSSPLDDIRPERWTRESTTELLELLWVLEATIEGYAEQEELLEAIVSGPCFRSEDLSLPSDEARRPPVEIPAEPPPLFEKVVAKAKPRRRPK